MILRADQLNRAPHHPLASSIPNQNKERRGNQCWFYHDPNHKAEKQSEIFKKTQTKQFKDEPKLEKETMQEHGPNLMQILKEKLKENSVKQDGDKT